MLFGLCKVSKLTIEEALTGLYLQGTQGRDDSTKVAGRNTSRKRVVYTTSCPACVTCINGKDRKRENEEENGRDFH